jgi:hypothetical protein
MLQLGNRSHDLLCFTIDHNGFSNNGSGNKKCVVFHFYKNSAFIRHLQRHPASFLWAYIGHFCQYFHLGIFFSFQKFRKLRYFKRLILGGGCTESRSGISRYIRGLSIGSSTSKQTNSEEQEGFHC